MYKVLSDGTVFRESDGSAIPPDPENMDYVAYEEWIKAGNVATPYATVTAEEKTGAD